MSLIGILRFLNGLRLFGFVSVRWAGEEGGCTHPLFERFRWEDLTALQIQKSCRHRNIPGINKYFLKSIENETGFDFNPFTSKAFDGACSYTPDIIGLICTGKVSFYSISESSNVDPSRCFLSLTSSQIWKHASHRSKHCLWKSPYPLHMQASRSTYSVSFVVSLHSPTRLVSFIHSAKVWALCSFMDYMVRRLDSYSYYKQTTNGLIYFSSAFAWPHSVFWLIIISTTIPPMIAELWAFHYFWIQQPWDVKQRVFN